MLLLASKRNGQRLQAAKPRGMTTMSGVLVPLIRTGAGRCNALVRPMSHRPGGTFGHRPLTHRCVIFDDNLLGPARGRPVLKCASDRLTEVHS